MTPTPTPPAAPSEWAQWVAESIEWKDGVAQVNIKRLADRYGAMQATLSALHSSRDALAARVAKMEGQHAAARLVEDAAHAWVDAHYFGRPDEKDLAVALTVAVQNHKRTFLVRRTALSAPASEGGG